MNTFRQKLKEIKKYVNKDFMRIKLDSNEIILRIVDTNDDTVNLLYDLRVKYGNMFATDFEMTKEKTKEWIEKYILDLIFCTRYPDKYKLEDIAPLISFGASPRGSINLALASKCYAFVKHRGYVIPEDVREVIYDVLRHRIGLTYEAEAENVSTEDLITKIINTIEVP